MPSGVKFGTLRTRLCRAAVRGLHDFGDHVFAVSQVNVPVDRGTLKKSGRIRYLKSGVEISYGTPYAVPVHEGVPEHDEEVQRHYVRPHKRRIFRLTRTGRRRPVRRTFVRGHYRGPFRRHVRERSARPWLREAIEEALPDLGYYILRRLREEFQRERKA